MVFSSVSFLFFLLPLFLILDAATRRKIDLRNYILIAFSLLFYTWGEGRNVILLLILGILNYIGGATLSRLEKATPKLVVLVIFLGLNLTALFYYKYLFWLASYLLSTSAMIDLDIKQRALPLGISFFTFHGISYLMDIYRGQISTRPTLSHFLTYFFMFPHLVAGPIVRYTQVAREMVARTFDKELFVYGMARLLLGINKKILIANSVAPMAEAAFDLPPQCLSTADAWLGALAFTVQIYFDFSGYSDMAIGLAAMAGFKFEENFKAPYTSRSIREFWHRWHISLSSWLRDYLYIPLGGSHGSEIRTSINLLVVFLLCGLWHGAQFTFVLWGLWHGTLLMLERYGLGSWLAGRHSILGRGYCLFMVMIGWIIFQSSSVGHALDYMSVMFKMGTFDLIIPVGAINLFALGAGLLIALFPRPLFNTNHTRNPQYSTTAFVTQTILALFSIVILYFGARNPFIYFNF